MESTYLLSRHVTVKVTFNQRKVFFLAYSNSFAKLSYLKSTLNFCVVKFKVARNNLRYVSWEVKCLKDGQRTFIKTLDSKGAVNIVKDRVTSMHILVEANRSLQVEKMFQDRDISYELAALDSWPAQQIKHRSKNPISSYPRLRSPLHKQFMDWDDFYQLNVIYQWMQELERMHPSTCTVSSIGRTTEGRDIKMLKISNSDASNTGVWIDGGTHAREWISISVASFIAQSLVSNFSTLPEYITNKDWYILPVVNPDGYHHSHAIDRMWRKNRCRLGNTIVGVDLNRNFGHYWGTAGHEAGSSGDPSHLNFRGAEPFSEPETAAIKDIILYSGMPFKMFLSFHACSEVISFPWCHSSDPCPDYVDLLEGATVMAKAMYETAGKMYRVGNFKDIMYYACGTSIDWSYGIARIPFSYLVELRSKERRFILPRNEILDCCKESLGGVLALAQYVDQRKCLNCSVFNARKS